MILESIRHPNKTLPYSAEGRINLPSQHTTIVLHGDWLTLDWSHISPVTCSMQHLTNPGEADTRSEMMGQWAAALKGGVTNQRGVLGAHASGNQCMYLLWFQHCHTEADRRQLAQEILCDWLTVANTTYCEDTAEKDKKQINGFDFCTGCTQEVYYSILAPQCVCNPFGSTERLQIWPTEGRNSTKKINGFFLCG